MVRCVNGLAAWARRLTACVYACRENRALGAEGGCRGGSKGAGKKHKDKGQAEKPRHRSLGTRAAERWLTAASVSLHTSCPSSQMGRLVEPLVTHIALQGIYTHLVRSAKSSYSRFLASASASSSSTAAVSSLRAAKEHHHRTWQWCMALLRAGAEVNCMAASAFTRAMFSLEGGMAWPIV